MAKTPVMGLVKTRLGRQIGAAEATRFYRATAAAVLGRLARDRRFEVVLAIAPDAGAYTRAFPLQLKRIAQGGGDLGARMQRIMDARGTGPVVIIGTDIPGICAAHLADAFRKLGSHDAVFGPADDGGFWLVGLKRFARIPRTFGGVRWSHAETLADVERRLERFRVARVATLPDVDEAADLKRQSKIIGRRVIGP